MLHITFNDQCETFFPGQEVKGLLNLILTSDTHISSIIICFSGVGMLQKYGKHDKENCKQEIYFDHIAYLFNSEDMDNVKKLMEKGSHSFPFEYVLPQKIPASFESPNGSVRYSVTAHMDKADSNLQSAVAFFTVNTIVDLNKIPKCRLPRTDCIQEDVCLFCFKCGPVSAVLNIPRQGYVPGEHILINAEINNLHNRPISYVKATLVQVIKYNYKTGPKKMKRAVAEVLRGSVMPYESQVWKDELLQIPPVATSRLAHCTLMNIWYNLYLHVCSSGLSVGETIKLLKVPIILGTVPLTQQVQDSEAGAGERLMTEIYLPSPSTEPCIFGPYSITDESAEGQVQITFTPLYVTYSTRTDSISELDA